MAKNLRAIRRRIASIKSTQQITKAMKMVAAAKLKRAQDRALSTRPFLAGVEELAGIVSSRVQPGRFNLLEKREEEKRVAILLYTSNRGLCGSYNSNLIRHAEDLAKSLKNEGKDVVLYHIGKKGHDYFKKRGYNIGRFFSEIRDAILEDQINAVTKELLNGYLSSDYDRLTVVSSRFKSAASSKPLVFTLLPIDIAKDSSDRKIIFEPQAEILMEILLKELLRSKIANAVLESYASEQGSRMAAMEAATSNAGEILKIITLDYNKARQSIITQELIEITSSSEAQANN